MTRRIRRRLTVTGLSMVAGAASPLWGPPLLRTMPVFEVRDVAVSGSRFVDPDVVRTLAAIETDASVWDPPRDWEERVRAHPLVADAHIRRSGFRELTVELREVRPVAFVATPVLRPVDGDGTLVPIDPTRHALDLPILLGAHIEGGRVHEEPSRRALSVVEQLQEVDSVFVGQVSEFQPAPGDVLVLRLLDGSHAERIILPLEESVQAFLRVEAALGETQRRGSVLSADARFRGQVVIRLRGAG